MTPLGYLVVRTSIYFELVPNLFIKVFIFREWSVWDRERKIWGARKFHFFHLRNFLATRR